MAALAVTLENCHEVKNGSEEPWFTNLWSSAFTSYINAFLHALLFQWLITTVLVMTNETMMAFSPNCSDLIVAVLVCSLEICFLVATCVRWTKDDFLSTGTNA